MWFFNAQTWKTAGETPSSLKFSFPPGATELAEVSPRPSPTHSSFSFSSPAAGVGPAVPDFFLRQSRTYPLRSDPCALLVSLGRPMPVDGVERGCGRCDRDDLFDPHQHGGNSATLVDIKIRGLWWEIWRWWRISLSKVGLAAYTFLVSPEQRIWKKPLKALAGRL
jgi:hypothetical protein